MRFVIDLSQSSTKYLFRQGTECSDSGIRQAVLSGVPAGNGNECSTPHEQESLQRQITATDKAIDALVYELLGLTKEEVRIAEGEKK